MRCLLRILNIVTTLSGLILGLCLVAPVNAQATRWQDFPPQLQQWLKSKQLAELSFENYLTSINQQTEAREKDGEFDHLIFFALQSKLFTDLPKIEPAQSAYEFVNSLKPDERVRYLGEAQNYFPASFSLPEAVKNRLQVFSRALSKSKADERLEYFQQFLEKTIDRKASKSER